MTEALAHRFDTQFVRGEREAAYLCDYYGRTRWLCIINEQGMAEQRRGIDRTFIDLETLERYTVEFKADFYRKGLAFIETVSVDTTGKPGWVYTCEADYLVYWVVHSRLAYWLEPEVLRVAIVGWLRRFGPEKLVWNRGYMTRGVLVPLAELALCMVRVDDLKGWES